MNKTNPFVVESLDGQIWDSLWYYPSSYKNGGCVLHHMYCVIGNGYDWQDGRLLNTYPDRDDTRDVYEQLSNHDFSFCPELETQFKIDHLQRNHSIDFVRKHAETLVADRYRDWKYLYPLSRYSRLANVPDDAQDDFVAGARLAIDLSYCALFKGGGLLSFHVGPDLVKKLHDATESSIQILDESIASIIERFGPDPRSIEKTGYCLWGSFSEYVECERRLNTSMRDSLNSII